MIGDNLSSHFSNDVIKSCEKYNIAFVCLPPNSTHLSQPLDVSFFGPLKTAWSNQLIDFKKKNPNTNCTNKKVFPSLVMQLFKENSFKANIKKNLQSGFRGTGIYPTELAPLLRRLQSSGGEALLTDIADTNLNTSLETFLRDQRFGSPPAVATAGPSGVQSAVRVRGIGRGRGRFKNVMPGTAVTRETLDISETEDQYSTSSSDEASSHVSKRARHCIVQQPTNPRPSDRSAIVLVKKSDIVLVKLQDEERKTKTIPQYFLAQVLEVADESGSDEIKVKYLKAVPDSNNKKFHTVMSKKTMLMRKKLFMWKIALTMLTAEGTLSLMPVCHCMSS
jgi:hypothetical protein